MNKSTENIKELEYIKKKLKEKFRQFDRGHLFLS